MSRLSDRKLLAVAVGVTASGASLFGAVGWWMYGSAWIGVLAAVTVTVEGTAAIALAVRWDRRERRKRVQEPQETGPEWTPEGWDLPPYERNPPTNP